MPKQRVTTIKKRGKAKEGPQTKPNKFVKQEKQKENVNHISFINHLHQARDGKKDGSRWIRELTLKD